MSTRAGEIAAEIGRVAAALDDSAIDSACARIANAGRVLVHGCGRERLQLQGLAMRLYHLGLRVGVFGEMTAPPLGPGDLFLASAGPGELATVTALMRTARGAGADVLFLTARPDATAASLADATLVIPAQTMAPGAGGSILPMGSAYEGALFVLFEDMVLRLADLLGVDDAAMRARHTNIE